MADPLVDRVVRSQKWLDPVGDASQAAIGSGFKILGSPGRWLKSLLHGSFLLGHALHPLLTDVPIGAWTVALIFDVAAHFTPAVPHVAGDLAVAIGWVAALGTVATGLTDYHETYGQERRVATAHGLLMTLVTLLYTVSLLMRWIGGPGVHGGAVWVSILGYAILTIGAYLGGHLVFDKGTMVNRNAFIEGPGDFVAVGAAIDFPEGSMKKVDAGGAAALVVRRNGVLTAIGNVCSHAGGPLDEGELHGDAVTCPWHGSRFCIADGSVREGPATFAQPTFEVREQAGLVELRLVSPLHE